MKANRKARNDTSLLSNDSAFAVPTQTFLIGILLTIIVAVVSLQFLGDNASEMVTSVTNVTTAIADADFGSTAANSVADGISILIPLGFILGLVALVGLVVTFKRQ